MDEIPWWYHRCVHRMFPLHKWVVTQEAEQVVVLYTDRLDQLHVCVNIADIGSSCNTMRPEDWESKDPQEQLKFVQSKALELRALHQNLE